MVTMAQRIGQLRSERNLSRPALSAALGLPRMAIEKFETGRQTPSQEQQAKLAEYFGVSLPYLRGESSDRLAQGNWMDGTFPEEAPPPAAPRPPMAKQAAKSVSAAQNSLFDSLFDSPKFQEVLHRTVLEVLRSPEGQTILSQAIRKALGK